MPWIFRLLALCHFGWAAVLVSLSGWFVASQMLALRHVSTGTFWSNVPWLLVASAMYTLPFTGLAAGLIVLGSRIWSQGPRLRTTVLRAHGLLLLIGIVAMAVGIIGVEAAEMSAARGGGIMSPLAWIPLLYGIPIVLLSAFSLSAAWLALPANREPAHFGENAAAAGRPRISNPFVLLFVWLLVAGGIILLWVLIRPLS